MNMIEWSFIPMIYGHNIGILSLQLEMKDIKSLIYVEHER